MKIIRKRVKVKDIKVPKDRIREELGDIKGLAESIQKYGLLHPLVLDENMTLISAERRLRAIQMLGWKEVDASIVVEANELEKKKIELEENIRRKDLTWSEEVKAKKQLHELLQKMSGGSKKLEGYWTIEDTAQLLGEATGKVSQDLQLAELIEKFPQLGKLSKKTHAQKALKQLELGVFLEGEKKGEGPKDEFVICGDAAKVLQSFEDESFDLILTDPPFGVELDRTIKYKRQAGYDVYEDNTKLILDLLEKVFLECYRILKAGRHAFVFYATKWHCQIKELLSKIGFVVSPYPFVWYKHSSMAFGDTSIDYETCFWAYKPPKRPWCKGEKPSLVIDISGILKERTHVAEKPGEVWQKFIEIGTFEGEGVLDPFAGTGSSLIQALRMGRKVKGIEINEGFARLANKRLKEVLEGR